jgi:spermidine/putrescine transport system ATP-binding protein/putrescine transport system ATP-binding protein
MIEPLIRVRGLNAYYGSVQALADIDLDIGDNEFFALLGPSGCGKTTLLRSIAGFETPTDGSITLGDKDLLSLPAHRRPVNMMFQSYALFPHMTAEKNIAYGPQRAGVPRREIKDRVAEVLTTVGLQDLGQRRPSQLSGGQRQRVALARAIVNRPRLLLLDEPLSALDRNVRAQMQSELKRLQHEVGIAFVIVTHDQEEAMSMADRIAVMDAGRIQQVAPPEELYRSPANRFVAEFVGRSNVFAGTAVAGGLAVDGFGLLPGRGTGSYLVIRPEDITIGAADPAANRIMTGTVVDHQFSGGTTHTTVVPDCIATLSGQPVTISHQGFPSHAVHTKVDLSWSADSAVIVS